MTRQGRRFVIAVFVVVGVVGWWYRDFDPVFPLYLAVMFLGGAVFRHIVWEEPPPDPIYDRVDAAARWVWRRVRRR